MRVLAHFDAVITLCKNIILLKKVPELIGYPWPHLTLLGKIKHIKPKISHLRDLMRSETIKSVLNRGKQLFKIVILDFIYHKQVSLDNRR